MTSRATWRLVPRSRPAGGAAIGSGVVLALLVSAASVLVGTATVSTAVVAAGGLGLIGVVALALWRYEAAVVLGVLLLGVVRVEPAPVDAVLGVVIALAVVTGRLRLRSTPWWVPWLVGTFVAVNLMSCLEVVAWGPAVRFLTITVYVVVLGLWTSEYVDSRGRARAILLAYLVGAVASAVLGSLALFVHFPGSSLLTDSFGVRAQGLFKDPNVYGPFLVVAAVLLLSELVEPRLLRGGRVVKSMALAALVIGVVLAYSRAGWLNLAVAGLVMALVLPLRRGGLRRSVALVLVGLVALTAAGVTVLATGSLPVLTERAQVQTYDTDRFDAQERGIALGFDRPLGIGPGQFEYTEPLATHNTYIRAFAEQGPAGLVVLSALVLGTLLLAVGNVLADRDTRGIAAPALLGVWCGLLVNSLFVDTLHWRHLWIVAGLIWAGARSTSGRDGAQRSATGRRTPT